jgi:hypothetical protein
VHYTTKDPIGFAGGLNLYVHVANNSVNLTGPSELYIAIEQVEAEEGYLDSMSPSAILAFARALKINPSLLI